jgi:hypothetical protein
MRRLVLAALFLPTVAPAISWQQAITDPHLTMAIHGDSRSRLTVQVSNDGAAPAKLEIPAGLVASGKNADRVATIRSATLEIPAGKTAEVELPAVPLSAKNSASEQEFTANSDAVLALGPLIEYSARQNDLPRATAQLTALLLLENVSFAHWQEFLHRAPSKDPSPAPTDITACVDGIAIARNLAPTQKFAMLDDGEFRLRAVRNPYSRAKAMQLFGLAAPEGVPVPDLNQLLHTGPGDNCPICRMRAQSADPSNGL